MIKVKSKALKKAIVTKGFSLSEFTKICGTTKSSISNVLKRETISAKYANKICSCLNVEFEDFFWVI